ncbi:response regulator transcription factor [Sphingomonas cavernae]|uniref:DNA-binding response regulator n=1 Tax=Sphingomonas cavernae TaxID=2320861 RepID=A0A418WSJ6_9SPHN|nr:response regulator transcription factor [Sphingomonas cavernae]RJF94224.1 DNA-binding response regulator [Sphingomonas cavernae]
MRIAIVEDDADYREYAKSLLRGAGYIVHGFERAAAFMKQFRQDTFDLVLIDWNMPDVSGFELVKWIRGECGSRVPIVMVTSRTEVDDIVAGLQAGADDYITKPVEGAVLLARLSALGRRSYPSDPPGPVQSFGEFDFNLPAEELRIAGEAVALTSKEFNLALTLFSNLSRPLSRNYLLEAVWGRNPDLPTRTLDSHISKIRTKLGLRPDRGFRLTPIYSYGYRLEAMIDAPPVISEAQ